MMYEMTFDANRKEEREITGFYLQPVFSLFSVNATIKEEIRKSYIFFDDLFVSLVRSVIGVDSFSEYFGVMKLIIAASLVVFGLYCVLAQSESAEETTNSPRKYCNKPACLETASRILYWMDQTIDICSDLYNFTCQGLSMVR